MYIEYQGGLKANARSKRRLERKQRKLLAHGSRRLLKFKAQLDQIDACVCTRKHKNLKSREEPT